MKFACVIAMIFVSVGSGMAQSCDCPSTCFGCVGGIIEYTLQYQGVESAEIVAKDQANINFQETLVPGDHFTVTGPHPSGRFAGNRIYLYIDGMEDTVIDARCTSNTSVNSKFGHFVIVAAKRFDGKSVCCGDGPKKDLIAPQFARLPEDIFVFTELDKCSAVVTWPLPLASDCNLVDVISNHEPGDEFSRGTTIVTYEAIDNADNSSLYSFTVTVTDNLPPSIENCPGNIEMTTTSRDGIVVLWNEPISSDNCSVQSFLPTHLSGSVFPVGVTLVTYTAIDQDGNSSTCSFEVKVILERTPEIPPPPPAEEVSDIIISEIITPDGDGKNDRWIIENIEHYPGSNVLVVDRWGSKIYSASDYNNESVAWRGVASGSGKLPSGTYFYVITYTRKGVHRQKKGFIELIP